MRQEEADDGDGGDGHGRRRPFHISTGRASRNEQPPLHNVIGFWDNEKRMLGKIKGLPLHSWKGKV